MSEGLSRTDQEDQLSDQSSNAAQLDRIGNGLALLEQFQALFGEDMSSYSERVRAWRYLRDRHPGWLADEMPLPEPLIDGSEEA